MADALEVEAGGLFTTVQDLGRYGWQRFGISPAGAMDPSSLRLANALVGNPPDYAVLEVTALGPTLRLDAATCRIAWAGEMTAHVGDRILEPWTAHDLFRGEVLRCGAVRRGFRAYVAVAHGFDLPPVLDSLSTHTGIGMGGLDGRHLAASDRLPLRSPTRTGDNLMLPERHRPTWDGPIRVMLGPQDDSFTTRGLATFLSGTYTVTAKANRMGMQLDGPAIEHRAGFNIVSDGIVHGSIQVTGQGLPIVLLADRQTTGGYTKIATAIGSDLARLAQRRPGATIRFERVSAAEAEALAWQAHRQEEAARSAIVPTARKLGSLSSAELLNLNLISGVVSAAD